MLLRVRLFMTFSCGAVVPDTGFVEVRAPRLRRRVSGCMRGACQPRNASIPRRFHRCPGASLLASTSWRAEPDCATCPRLNNLFVAIEQIDQGDRSGIDLAKIYGMGDRAALHGLIEALLEAGIERDRLGGLGIGCPGMLDLDKGILQDAPNLGWKDVKLKDLLEKALGCPAVVLNDVDAGGYGE